MIANAKSDALNLLTDETHIASMPKECQEFDVNAITAASFDIAEQVVDYFTNIDVTANQFDTQRMMDDAEKLGLDLDDLQEFGFDVRNNNCGGTGCRTESLGEFMAKYDRFKAAIKNNLSRQWERMRCHPTMKHVVPRV